MSPHQSTCAFHYFPALSALVINELWSVARRDCVPENAYPSDFIESLLQNRDYISVAFTWHLFLISVIEIKFVWHHYRHFGIHNLTVRRHAWQPEFTTGGVVTEIMLCLLEIKHKIFFSTENILTSLEIQYLNQNC